MEKGFLLSGQMAKAQYAENKKKMKHPLRSAVTTTGRRMAEARSLWRANGMREEQFGRPVIGIATRSASWFRDTCTCTRYGQYVKQRIEALGVAKINTIAIDDGIAMGHDGMLYSLPSREIIADSVEYMANAHKVDALVCISNCDEIHPGHADGRHAARHPDRLRIGRADGGGASRRAGARPDRRHGNGCRRKLQRRTGGARRTRHMPRLRFVLGDVHRQLDELPDRSARALAPGQRHRRGHACQPPPPVRRGRSADRPQCRSASLRGRRLGAPALGGHEGSLRECHVAGHRHGRLDQYGAAPAGRGPRGRGGFHDPGCSTAFRAGCPVLSSRSPPTRITISRMSTVRAAPTPSRKPTSWASPCPW